jgi:hypothetical protein
MQGFREHIDETTQMRLVDLLPKKIKRKIYRIAHADKYKGALAMYHSFKKNADMKKRGVSDQKMRDIAADHFKLNHKEFAKILNRQTRYEALDEEYITEAEGTTASTLFEGAIVAFINYGGLKQEKKFIEAINKDQPYLDWLAKASKDKKWNLNQSDHYKFAKKVRQVTNGKKATQAGQSKEITSAMWTEVTKKGKDTSKADINIGKSHKVSVKGIQARLMSGVKEESLATLYAAFISLGVYDLGYDLENIIKGFVSRVKTEGAEMDTTTIRKQDFDKLSAKNQKAFKDLKQQTDVKGDAEKAFQKAFKDEKFAKAFAWEAMSGEQKFAKKVGVANAMLVWPYNLKGVSWHPGLTANHKYVGDVAGAMRFSANVKSNSRRVKGIGKTGYTISQTVDLAFKTAEDEFQQANESCLNQRINLENMLTEGKINEIEIIDKLKGVWTRLVNAIKTAWAKLINMIEGLTQQIKDAIDSGLGVLLNEFGFEAVVKHNNIIRLK